VSVGTDLAMSALTGRKVTVGQLATDGLYRPCN
jgi:hypothetical protein